MSEHGVRLLPVRVRNPRQQIEDRTFAQLCSIFWRCLIKRFVRTFCFHCYDCEPEKRDCEDYRQDVKNSRCCGKCALAVVFTVQLSLLFFILISWASTSSYEKLTVEYVLFVLKNASFICVSFLIVAWCLLSREEKTTHSNRLEDLLLEKKELHHSSQPGTSSAMDPSQLQRATRQLREPKPQLRAAPGKVSGKLPEASGHKLSLIEEVSEPRHDESLNRSLDTTTSFPETYRKEYMCVDQPNALEEEIEPKAPSPSSGTLQSVTPKEQSKNDDRMEEETHCEPHTVISLNGNAIQASAEDLPVKVLGMLTAGDDITTFKLQALKQSKVSTCQMLHPNSQYGSSTTSPETCRLGSSEGSVRAANSIIDISDSAASPRSDQDYSQKPEEVNKSKENLNDSNERPEEVHELKKNLIDFDEKVFEKISENIGAEEDDYTAVLVDYSNEKQTNLKPIQTLFQNLTAKFVNPTCPTKIYYSAIPNFDDEDEP